MLQISSGLLRGLPLKSPQGKNTRPSGERLRQAIFNILRHYRWQDSTLLENAVVADLFAGTGALGLEALSNGATECQFVESNSLALRVLSQNVEVVLKSYEAQKLEPPKMHVFSREIEKVYAKLVPSRVIFCDPPYKLDWFLKVIELEKQHQKLESGGVLLFESDASEALQLDLWPDLKHFDTKNYGDSSVHFFVKK